ncbi:hypothetical protein [Pseudomonas putida]|uniref:hypothetical protein n=1 Tax=Pseudomonas putida TaxID=303 RepID=UPI00081975EC|nr:hypothetical protein [Pseudomonas putida]OCT24306.1 hypothetical protein A6E23_15435 [Pseudomonas putida]OCT27386.1 hypothetical protein A6E20_08395 [Pseudomonas putida]OCT28669.1 hypothetical protein A6E24_08210 [Pseudomonas putida]OCT38099.1 hypothetical protein A6E19_13090 [Pseudomonas putida]
MQIRFCLLFSIISGLLGCGAKEVSVQPVRPPAQTQLSIKQTASSQPLVELNKRGEQVIAQLKAWYDATPADCAGPDKPSYLCSGIEMRATETSPDVFSWDPSQKHLDKGAIAFSWVRRDTNFARPAERFNGFLFPPLQAIPDGKINDLQVLCTFPTDGGTDNRETAQGCGPQRRFEATTDACQKIGIQNAQEWLQAYSEDDIRRSRFCGWDLREEPANMRAQWFEMPVKIRASLEPDAWMGYNEILLPVWEVGVGSDLPIYAFFYVEGEQQARVLAQHDQVRYHAAYGQSIPVVRIKFPTNKDQLMVFTYADEDQAVGQPVPSSKIDFESEDLGERKVFTIDGVTFMIDGRGSISNELHEGSEGLISGKHLKYESLIQVVLSGTGRRQVSYNWGCTDHCIRDALLSDNYKVLTDGPDAYGTDRFIIDGPDIITLYIGEEGQNLRMVLDTLEVKAVTQP